MDNTQTIRGLEDQLRMFTKIKELYNVDFDIEVARIRQRLALQRGIEQVS